MGPSRAGDDRADDLGGQEGTTNRSHRKVLKQARKSRSYASPKLSPTHRVTY